MGARLSTKEVVLNILKCLVVFYSLYYVVGSICFAIYRLTKFDGRIPFNIQSWIELSRCCTGYTSEQMVDFLSLVLTYVLSGFVYGLISRHWVWDYALTVTLFHLCVCCLVNLNFPMIWSWWVSLVFGLLLQIGVGETVSFIRRRKMSVKVAVSPDQEPSTFLYKKL